jgi:hypothetical protein
MLLPQRHVERYLQEFIGVMRRIERSTTPGMTPRGTSLSDAFFGANAVSLLGLGLGRRSRERLEAFYGKHEVATPDWMQKVG